MRISIAGLLVLASDIIPSSGTTVTYKVTNAAATLPGGARFDREIGISYSEQVLADASSFIWSTFNQTQQDRKDVSAVTLTIESMPGGVAYTSSNSIHMSAEYIGNYSSAGGDVRTEFTGIMFHEMTHVWQWNGAGAAPGGLIEGIADYVRLKAGYAPAHWVSAGGGDRWDAGYDVTARFLDYCSGKRSSFVAELNARMRSGYSDGIFVELLGETVDELWHEYKAKYGGH